MAVIDIERIELLGSPAIRAAGFDRPLAPGGLGVYDIEALGWVLGATAKPVEIAIHSGPTQLRRAPLDLPRPDLAEHYPDLLGDLTPGWRTSVNVVGLEPGEPLTYSVTLDDETVHPLAKIHFRRQPLVTGFQPRLQPLMLTTLGRAGTTWMMRVLAEHPGIVVHRAHPYELRIARHWLHSFKVLTEPKDLHHSAHADSFANNRSWTGHNPFYPVPLATTPGLWQWYGKTYVEEAAFMAQRWIDEAYSRIAEGQQEPAPVYFAEKHRADLTPWLIWELYAKPKEIFLVRDFRDVISSMLSFNRRQGRPVFGPKEPNPSIEDFVKFIRRGPIRLLSQSWERRHDRALLVRYEDLIQEPEATLERILSYLELDKSPETISAMLDRASKENPEMTRHKTSSAVSSSIGRWRESLSPEAQAACNDLLADALSRFGYPVEVPVR